ncbi:MAG: IS5 family transposase [Chitinophagaceae bacterium]
MNRQQERLKKGAQSIGRSRGGLSTKLHLAVTAGGNAVKILVSQGHRADLGYADELLENLHPKVVVADRGYDFDIVISTIEQLGAKAVIPCKSNRKVQRRTNWKIYKSRNIIERYINKLKHFRRVATRYDKTDANYMSFVFVAASVINFKTTVNTT